MQLRRTIGLGIAALLTVGLLSSCSSGEDADSPTDSSTTSDAFPVTIDHNFGSTTIPEKPERVVALGVSDTDVLLALGIVPVANSGYQFYANGLGPWTKDAIGDAEVVYLDSDSEPNLEKVAGLAPDLIVGVSAGFDENTYAKLSKIAPTVGRPTGTSEYAVGRAEQTEMIATAMGQKAKGIELNQKIDTLFEETIAAHPSFAGKTGIAVLPFDGQYAAYGPREGRGQFLTSLGFTIPEAVTNQDDGVNFYVPVSAENVNMLDSDLILVLGPDASYDAIAQNPAMGTLNAARNNAIIATTLDERGAISFNSVLSIPFAINSLVPRIAQVVK